MPGQPGSETRIRRHIVQVRMDDAELAQLDHTADAAGVSRAEVLRRLANTGEVRARDTDRIVAALSRVGGLLNQLAKVANATGRMDDSAALSAALDQLRSTITELDE